MKKKILIFTVVVCSLFMIVAMSGCGMIFNTPQKALNKINKIKNYSMDYYSKGPTGSVKNYYKYDNKLAFVDTQDVLMVTEDLGVERAKDYYKTFNVWFKTEAYPVKIKKLKDYEKVLNLAFTDFDKNFELSEGKYYLKASAIAEIYTYKNTVVEVSVKKNVLTFLIKRGNLNETIDIFDIGVTKIKLTDEMLNAEIKNIK